MENNQKKVNSNNRNKNKNNNSTQKSNKASQNNSSTPKSNKVSQNNSLTQKNNKTSQNNNSNKSKNNKSNNLNNKNNVQVQKNNKNSNNQNISNKKSNNIQNHKPKNNRNLKSPTNNFEQLTKHNKNNNTNKGNTQKTNKGNFEKQNNNLKENKKNQNIQKNDNKKLQPYKPKKVNESNNAEIQNAKKEQEVVNKTTEVKTKVKKSKLPLIIILGISVVILLILSLFIINLFGNKINSNIYIENIEVSKLEFCEAKEKIENEYKNILGKDIKYIYNEQEYSINLDDIQFSVLIDEAVNKAQKIGRNTNIISAAKEYYDLKFGNTQMVDLEFEYDREKLYSKIKEIENNFYKEVKQYTYVTEENKLKITKGSEGIEIEYEKLENELLSAIKNRDIPEFFNIPICAEQPEEIDVDKIHSEVYVKVANAYYETKPFKIYNEVKGVDFDKQQLSEMITLYPENNEYVIDLKITEPEITVDGLGLYNDVLGECRTAYVNNPNRTTNLRLAANKINGKILMPGESFSYNEIVGERTVAAGYKNAAIYINGEVEDGLAGGICQISSTLYDAVVYSNLQVDERYNHARVPSYVTAGRDATVYWGSKDFKFTNNRDYPIKISVTVNGGYATATILGMKTANEYDISFASSVVSRYNGYMVVKTYKVYKQNGVEVKRELISTDSYKV